MTLDWKTIQDGMIAGLLTRFVIEPFDLVKIRMQLNESSVASTIPSTIRTVYRNEGLLAFWKGNVFGTLLYASYTGVQFFAYQNLNMTNTSAFWKGSIAGSIATLTTYPFDMLRTRTAVRKDNALQLRNSLQTVVQVYRNEGVLAFSKGLGPTLLAVIPSTGISFWTFEKTRAVLYRLSPSENKNAAVNAMAGAVAGMAAKVCTMPLDVVRKRLQVQSLMMDRFAVKTSEYSGSFDAVAKIMRREGIRGFYKGLSAALLKTVPATSIIFVSYYAMHTENTD